MRAGLAAASWRGWQGTRRLQLCTVLGACGGVWRECGAADVVRTHRYGLAQLGAVLGHLDRLLVSLTCCLRTVVSATLGEKRYNGYWVG